MIGLLAAVEESGYFSRLVMVGHVPVIVFSSSEKPQDKSVFNQPGIEYFTKPSSINNRGRLSTTRSMSAAEPIRQILS